MRFSSKKDIKINLRLSEKEYNFVKDSAEEYNVPISEMIRMFIDINWMKKESRINENVKNNIND